MTAACAATSQIGQLSTSPAAEYPCGRRRRACGAAQRQPGEKSVGGGGGAGRGGAGAAPGW